MRCNPSARWGPGTTKERATDTESSKQLKSKMEEMLKEREKQNAMWQPLTSETQDREKETLESPKK
jgi:hypothetical protein